MPHLPAVQEHLEDRQPERVRHCRIRAFHLDYPFFRGDLPPNRDRDLCGLLDRQVRADKGAGHRVAR